MPCKPNVLGHMNGFFVCWAIILFAQHLFFTITLKTSDTASASSQYTHTYTKHADNADFLVVYNVRNINRQYK